MHHACEEGHVEVAKWLNEQGARVDVTDNDGKQPMHHACEEGHVEVAKWLKEQGARVDVTDRTASSRYMAPARMATLIRQDFCLRGALLVTNSKVGNHQSVLAWLSDPLGMPISSEAAPSRRRRYLCRRAASRQGQLLLAGPPGTGKTELATRIAASLCYGEPSRWEIVQFHPSYSHTRTLSAGRAKPEGGFCIQPGHLLEIMQRAESNRPWTHVLIIDELNRANMCARTAHCLQPHSPHYALGVLSLLPYPTPTTPMHPPPFPPWCAAPPSSVSFTHCSAAQVARFQAALSGRRRSECRGQASTPVFPTKSASFPR